MANGLRLHLIPKKCSTDWEFTRDVSQYVRFASIAKRSSLGDGVTDETRKGSSYRESDVN